MGLLRKSHVLKLTKNLLKDSVAVTWCGNTILDILIYYNTASRGLTDIYARLSRERSARGRVHIYQSNPEQAVL